MFLLNCLWIFENNIFFIDIEFIFEVILNINFVNEFWFILVIIVLFNIFYIFGILRIIVILFFCNVFKRLVEDIFVKRIIGIFIYIGNINVKYRGIIWW